MLLFTMLMTCALHVEVNKYACIPVLQTDTVISDNVFERNNNNRITYIYIQQHYQSYACSNIHDKANSL